MVGCGASALLPFTIRLIQISALVLELMDQTGRR